MTERELKLLQQMAREYPTVQAASAEIINLTAILNLPKGTEHCCKIDYFGACRLHRWVFARHLLK